MTHSTFSEAKASPGYDFTQADRDDEASHWKAVSGPVGGTGESAPRLVEAPRPLLAWLDGDTTGSVGSALFGACLAVLVIVGVFALLGVK